MNLYCDYDDREGGYVEEQRTLEDPRLLDAAETLVTLQTSDLVSTNNPLFGSSLTVLQNSDPYRDDKRQYLLGDLQSNLLQFDPNQPLQDESVHMPHIVQHPSNNPSVIVPNEQVAMSTSRGRGRGRGPSKRGRKKAEGGGRGGGAGMGAAEMEEDNQEPEVQEKKAEMLRVGPLFINSNIIDQILSERKQELMEHPSVLEFLSRNKP